jgi:hypothetical protein
MKDYIRKDKKNLFHNIGAKLLSRKKPNIAQESLNQKARDCQFVELKNVLDDIVAKGILNQNDRVGCNLIDQLQLLGRRCSVNTSLNNTAAMAMCCDFNTSHCYGVVDELVVMGLKELEALLNDVVSIEVLGSSEFSFTILSSAFNDTYLDQSNNVITECVNHQVH